MLRLALVSCREQPVAPAIQERPANRADFSRLVCPGPYLPMQKLAKMRLRMSSAVVVGAGDGVEGLEGGVEVEQ